MSSPSPTSSSAWPSGPPLGRPSAARSTASRPPLDVDEPMELYRLARSLASAETCSGELAAWLPLLMYAGSADFFGFGARGGGSIAVTV